MIKGNPADVRELAEDLTRAMDNHQDALKHNPDLAADIMKLRDKTRKRWEEIASKGLRS